MVIRSNIVQCVKHTSSTIRHNINLRCYILILCTTRREVRPLHFVKDVLKYSGIKSIVSSSVTKYYLWLMSIRMYLFSFEYVNVSKNYYLLNFNGDNFITHNLGFFNMIETSTWHIGSYNIICIYYILYL